MSPKPNSEPDRTRRAFSPSENSEQGSTSSGPWLPLVSQEGGALGRSSSLASMASTEEEQGVRVGKHNTEEGREVGRNDDATGEDKEGAVAGSSNEEKKDEGGDGTDGFVTAPSSVVGAASSDEEEGDDEAEAAEGEDGQRGGSRSNGSDDAEADNEAGGRTGRAAKDGGASPPPSGIPQGDTSTETNRLRSSLTPPRRPLPPPSSVVVPFVCLPAGLRRKATPTALKSWVALSLTLDGRDKITKLGQYLSRLLGYYYESAARRIAGNVLGSEGAAEALLIRAKRFRALQKQLTHSRKAYRLGRSLVEVEKLRGMGWGPFLAYHLRRMVLSNDLDGGDGGEEGDSERGGVAKATVAGEGGDDAASSPPPPSRVPIGHRASSNVGWGPTTTFGEDGGAEQSPLPPPSTTGEADTESNSSRKKKKKAGGQPQQPPPRLFVRRASSNIGWGPATATASLPPSTASSRRSSFYRTVSQLGRRMYRPLLTSQLSAALMTSSDGGDDDKRARPPSTPTWKLIGATLKIIGLMGFWMGDNTNFLASAGFLDDYSLSPKERAKVRDVSKTKAGHFAARAYFFGAVSGLYVSLREALWHRNGPLRKAVGMVADLEGRRRRIEEEKESETAGRRTSWDMESVEEEEDGTPDSHHRDEVGERELEAARSALEGAKAKQFVLFLALLKSCCDVIVFSNNPGIDLHLRYRGKKMHEGFHSVCGLLSASTVIYNNFPNSSKGA